jgi:Flp pilus assembly pilin Flp
MTCFLEVFRRLARDRSGAVTTEIVILTAAIVLLAISLWVPLQDGVDTVVSALSAGFDLLGDKVSTAH